MCLLSGANMENVSITEVQTLSAISVHIIIAKSYACAGLDGVGDAVD